MTSLSSRSTALLLCSAIFLLVPVFTRADVSFSEIGGKYVLERKSLTMCRPTAEVRNIDNVIPSNSVSFGGVDCSFQGFLLSRQFGIRGLSRDRNDSIGTAIFGNSGPWTCHSSTVRFTDMVFFRPTAAVSYRSPGFSTQFPFQKDVLYFDFAVFGLKPGSCNYRFSSKSEDRNKSTESKAGGTNCPTNRGGPSMWVWLGPILGAVAAIAAALIIIVRYVRSSVASNFQVASSFA